MIPSLIKNLWEKFFLGLEVVEIAKEIVVKGFYRFYDCRWIVFGFSLNFIDL